MNAAALDPLDLTFATGLTVERGVPLAPFTSLKVGGPADLFVRARGPKELARCLDAAQERRLPWLLIGHGSNLLVSDEGFRGMAIKVEAQPGQRNRGQVLSETRDAVRLRCEAGTLTAGLARWTASLGWRGFEWGCGVPGTVGGAAAGNAGAYGGNMAATVERIRAWFPAGERVLEAPELRYDYRTSVFKRSGEPAAILTVDLRLGRGEPEAALLQIEQNEARRRANQPSERSCGSVFKNPTPDFAGRLIDAAGLKGEAVGGAQISERHGNFFVNRGQARAADLVALIRLARQRVEEVHGIRLQIEILLAGEWPADVREELQ